MAPRLNKLILTIHIIFSVGWLGTVAAFIALAITGVLSSNIQLSRACYLAMEVTSWWAIVPFCLGALLTGIIQSFGTKWGLFKHYWIVAKLILTIGATILLLAHLKPISLLAEIAAKPHFLNAYNIGWRVLADAGAGFLALIAITVISIFKPWGRTPYGLQGKSGGIIVANNIGITRYLLIGLAGLILTGLILLHLFGESMHGH